VTQPAATAYATAYLALGSNQGDRAANLRAACHLLAAHPAIKITARSAIYETQSVEGGGPGDFLNAALRVRTTLAPLELLHATQAVEAALGRPQPPRQGPRLIDVDVLLYDDVKLDVPGLHLPHPRMWRRAFVLRPLCDVLEGGWLKLTDEKLGAEDK
jgi:2-amino-4-hydroxy-6-hydroxymethyldihydropteridine diphosphokinase